MKVILVIVTKTVIFWEEIPIYEQGLIYCTITGAAQINYSQERILISQSHGNEPSSTFVRLNHTGNVFLLYIFLLFPLIFSF